MFQQNDNYHSNSGATLPSVALAGIRGGQGGSAFALPGNNGGGGGGYGGSNSSRGYLNGPASPLSHLSHLQAPSGRNLSSSAPSLPSTDPPPKSTAKANFTGVFSLRTQGEVQALVDAVRFLVENGVNLFYAYNNVHLISNLKRSLAVIPSSAQKFIELAHEGEEKQRAERITSELQQAESNFIQHLSSHPPGSVMQESTKKHLSESLCKILLLTADLTDLMEDNQTQMCLRSVKKSFDAMVSLNNPHTLGHGFTSRSNHAERILEHLCKLLDNRVQVTTNPDVKNTLQLASQSIRLYMPKMLSLFRVAASTGQPTSTSEMKIILTHLKTLLELLDADQARVMSNAGFGYEKINEALNHLEQAMKGALTTGATDKLVGCMKALVGEIRNLQGTAEAAKPNTQDQEAQAALQNTCDNLKAQTMKLIDATKTFVDKDKPGGQDEMQRAIEDTRVSLATLKPTTGSRVNADLRKTLLQASKDISSGMAEVTDVLKA